MTDEVAKRLDRIEAQLAKLTASIEALGASHGGDVAASHLVEAGPSTSTSGEDPDALEQISTASAPFGDLLTDLFVAALMEEPEECWRCLETLTHPDELQAPRALDHLRAFNWKRFRNNAPAYLKNGDPGSWVIATTDPESHSGGQPIVKLFLERRDANPAPVTVGRDGVSGGPWRVRNLSL